MVGVMPIFSADAKCKRDGESESCGIETRGGAGSNSSGGSSNAARNQAIIDGVAAIISGIISNSDGSDAVIADPEKALPRLRSFEKLFEPSKEFYEQRRNELFTRGEAEAKRRFQRQKATQRITRLARRSQMPAVRPMQPTACRLKTGTSSETIVTTRSCSRLERWGRLLREDLRNRHGGRGKKLRRP